VFLGFERLVQAFRIAAARHHAAGEFVDDHDLAVADDVVLVALEQLVGAQRLVDVVDQRDVLGVVEASRPRQQAGRRAAASSTSLPASVKVTVRCFSSFS
jgi:hypothetical protein